MAYEDHVVPALDDTARNNIAPQFHIERSDSGGDDHPSTGKLDKGESGGGGIEDEASGDDDQERSLVSNRDSSSAYDSGDDSSDESSEYDSGESNGEHTHGEHTGAFSTRQATRVLPCMHRRYLDEKLQLLEQVS